MNALLAEVWSFLPTFHAVARAGSVTGAADRIGISPPAVSKSVKTLEARLGGAVFLRRPRGVELTETGRALFEATERAMSDLERGLLTSGPNPLRATVRLAFMGTLDRLLTAPVAGALREDEPGLKLSVSNARSAARALTELEEGRIDALFAINVAAGHPFAADYVASMPMAIFVGRGNPHFDDDRPLDAEAWRRLPFVARAAQEGMKSIWPRHLERDVRLEVDSHALALEACLEGGFAIVMSRYAGRTWVAQDRLRELPADFLEPARVDMIALESRRDEPALALLLGRSRAVAQSWEAA